MTRVSRRTFLTSLLLAPTLTMAVSQKATAAPAEMDLGDVLVMAGRPTEHLLVVIDVRADGTVGLELPRAEVGQGLTTSLAMLVADELDIPVDAVRATLADARPELLFNQMTGSSNSVRSMYWPVRHAAAAVRARLIAAAAVRWAVFPDSITLSGGVVEAADGRSAGIGDFAVAAADPLLKIVPSQPKSTDQLRLVGTPTRRSDARAMITGSTRYALDLDIPGALPVVVRRPPSIGGTVTDVDEDALRAMPGVVDVAVVPTGVAVMAETFGQAIDAASAAVVTWAPGPVDAENDETIRARLRDAVEPFTTTGELEAGFDFAFVSHAAMETNSAVADVRSDSAEIWGSMQTPIVAKQVIAGVLGLPVSKVSVHVVNAGGSFGRRLFFDAPLEAARISRAMGRPVRLMWTRVDDMRHGRARAASHHRFLVRTDGQKVASFEHRIFSVATDFSHGFGEILTASGSSSSGRSVFSQTVVTPYSFGEVIESLREVPLPMNTGSWRSVFSATSRGAAEVVVDRIAAKLGIDPVQFRRAHLGDARHRAVLDAAARESGWGAPMPDGWARGVGFHAEYRSCTACVVDMDATDPKRPRVRRAVIAVDVGKAINPSGLEAQMQGGLTDAISTTLTAGLHIDAGLPLEGSFSQFHFARQRDSPPEVRVIVIDSSDDPGGAGELGVPSAVGAIANAYERATGSVVASFPISFDIDFEPFPR
ncbi:xanthine dehydrogenase family protein molybdopterin-binding subunit [Rhodococcus sp. P1Y]|uniref:xanthine dehydrogenase family protein molybdopterin-binding subunit n=1 Tax=Rhodococcus sp. P1Y TaxID=1302308 RepID=UPI000EADC7C9|nr:molybdopterin cofactor-binding domain-containing protein [Rhodococcus sp. P1Y]AYJ47865.1 xanthine dehydrogenase family protein molybdopterin-binding subunit [Rhodococcus sp. P1Y]